MRRWFLLLLVTLLLLSLTAPALGADHRETAMYFLKAKYDMPADQIQLYEGGIIDLEFTGESFWCAKYSIGDPQAPASGGTIALPPGIEPAPLPAPDTTQTKPAIRPLPPDYVPEDTNIYGALYIRLKTGAVLEMEDIESFFAAENALSEKEWERLRAEAGNLDVSLYLRLTKVGADEKVSVWIQPTPVITDSLKAQFAALKAKYPKVGADTNLEDLFFYARASILPTIGRAVSTDLLAEPVTDGILVALPDGSGSSGQSTGESPTRKPGDETIPDEAYWLEHQTFWQALEEIRTAAVAQSLTDIKAALDGMGATFNESGSSLTADLTAAQIRALASLPAVSFVLEDMVFTTMEDGVLMGRGSSDAGATGDGAAPPVMSKATAGESASAANTSPAVYATAVLVVGVLMGCGLRAINLRRK